MQRNESDISEIVSPVLVILLSFPELFFPSQLSRSNKLPILSQGQPLSLSRVPPLFSYSHRRGNRLPGPGHGTRAAGEIFLINRCQPHIIFLSLPRAISNGGKTGVHRWYSGPCQIRGVSDSTASVQNNVGFFNGTWTINIIDANSNVLIAQHTVTLTGGGTPSPYPVYPGFTAEAWVNWYTNPSSGAQYATIVVNGSNDYNRNYQLQVTDNKFELAIATFDHGSGGIWISSPKTLTDYNMVPGTWYYVTGVYNQTPGTMAIFVNGV